MFLNLPLVMHSLTDDQRHWFTTMGIPPIQVEPVAGNHCRVGHALALLLVHKLDSFRGDIPGVVTLDSADLNSTPNFAHRFNPARVDPAGVSLLLEMVAGPEAQDAYAFDAEDAFDDDEDEEVEENLFITPRPPGDWAGSYDEWLFTLAAALGLEPPVPLPTSSYPEVFAAAKAQVQARLPAIRERFLAGMGELHLGFKVGLPTRDESLEYVWVRPIDWSDAATLVAVLESRPHDCPGFKLGQQLQITPDELVDYAIGSESEGVVDPGYTQRIAEDYGLMIA